MIVGILSPNCDFWFAEGLEGEADAEIEAFLAEAAVQEARGAGFGDLGALLALSLFLRSRSSCDGTPKHKPPD